MRRPASQALQPAPADSSGRLAALIVAVLSHPGFATHRDATGVVLAGYLGRRATRRLETRQAGVLKLLADAAR
jgi:hypothetical protein